MSSTSIVIPRKLTPILAEGFKIEASAQAEEQVKKLLLKTKEIKAVTAENQAEVTTLTAAIKGLAKDVEKNHEEIKRPFLKATQEIDAIKRGFFPPLETEFKRLERLIGQYVQEVRRQQEEDRLEAERAAIELAEASAAIGDNLAELQQQLAAAKTPARRAKLQEAIKALQKQQSRAEFDAAEAHEVASITHLPAPVISGAKIQEEAYEIEITDLHALYLYSHEHCANVPLVKPVEPLKKNIRDWIALTGKNIPGVKLVPVVKVNVKGAQGFSLR